MTEKKYTEEQLFMRLAMQDFNKVSDYYFSKNPDAAASALMVVARSTYIKAFGPEVAAMLFYKLADELAVKVSKKHF